MPDLFEIASAQGAYPVRLSEGGLGEVVEACKPGLVIADAFFREALDATGTQPIFIPAVEPEKELSRMPALIEACRVASLTRNGRIIAIGGGVIQDIACFVASIYMRGLEWVYVPTTLLAMVDSCIGGKSSINVGEFKNIVGTFNTPSAIVIPPSVLSTLPAQHIAAGRCEAAKVCFARGPEAFARYLQLDAEAGPWPARNAAAVIEHSLRCKQWFIEVDEFDRAERLLLNFGHSFGHAIESCTGYDVPHGVAVGVGCLAAASLSETFAPVLANDEHVIALKRHLREVLRSAQDLSPALEKVGRDEFFDYFNSDKKHSVAEYRPILIDADGALRRPPLPRDRASQDALWEAFCAARTSLAEPALRHSAAAQPAHA